MPPSSPKNTTRAYSTLANAKLSEAFSNTSVYYKTHGDTGLRDYARAELKRCADRVRLSMARNVFLHPEYSQVSEATPK